MKKRYYGPGVIDIAALVLLGVVTRSGYQGAGQVGAAFEAAREFVKKANEEQERIDREEGINSGDKR